MIYKRIWIFQILNNVTSELLYHEIHFMGVKHNKKLNNVSRETLFNLIHFFNRQKLKNNIHSPLFEE